MTQFDKKFTALFNRKFTTLVNSGTHGILLALRALKLPANTGVIMPSICCPSVMTAIQLAGHTPVISDVNQKNFSMGVEELKTVHSVTCSAVIAVHAYGRECDIVGISKFCEFNGLALIEDACLAYGNITSNGPIGSFGDISILSFGYDKPLDCGGGGAIMTNDESTNSLVKKIVHDNPIMKMGRRSVDILESKLPKLTQANAIRWQNSSIYSQEIKSQNLTLPEVEYGYWRMPVLLNGSREQFLMLSKEQGLIFTTHYHSLSPFSSNAITPVADKVGGSIINLFVRPETPMNTIKNSIKFLNEFDYGQ